MVQQGPVLTDAFIDAGEDGILAGEVGAEGVVEVEVGEIFGGRVSVVVGSCAAAAMGLAWAEIVVMWRGIVGLWTDYWTSLHFLRLLFRSETTTFITGRPRALVVH